MEITSASVSFWRAPLFALLLATGAPGAARADDAALRTVQQLDQLVTDIGYRLQSHGGDLCARTAPLPGFGLHDLSQYDDTAGARAFFGFSDRPVVLAVAKGSAAEAGGLRPGDALLAIDGRAEPPFPAKVADPYAMLGDELGRIEAAAADGALDLDVRRDGKPLTLHLALASGCPSRFITRLTGTISSGADGTYVEINSGMIGFVQTEGQLAAIVAHELAHNILRHRERLDAAGIDRGLLGGIGKSARIVRRAEEEADRLSVYLMDRAGYDPQEAVTFWQRYRKTHPLTMTDAKHMGSTDRIALLKGEIARLATMKAAGRSPRPAFMEGGELPSLR
jgi:beta-barrel assembly-enhancing protease